MRVLAIDTETTGLDPKKDRVIEYGWALWDTDRAARAFLRAELGRLVAFDASRLDLRWIDTMADLPYEGERGLLARCADHGFVQSFRHRALFDALSCCLLLKRYPLEQVIARADSPEVVLHSQHAFEANEDAKSLGFGFKPALGKRWLKVVKEIDLPTLKERAATKPTLRIRVAQDLTPAQVRAA